jgi:predicted phosphodiesterase
MRIALFSDIHGNVTGLEAVFQDIEKSGGADYLVAAGDLVTEGAGPAETFDLLVQKKCLMVRGNHDDFLLYNDKKYLSCRFLEQSELLYFYEQKNWVLSQLGPGRLAQLAALPFEVRIAPPYPYSSSRNVLVVHANLKNNYGYTGNRYQLDEVLPELYGDAPADVSLIAFGHWHDSSVREWQGKKLVNVASVCYPRDKERLASYTTLQWNPLLQDWDIEQRRVPYDWEKEAYRLIYSGAPLASWQLDYYTLNSHSF